MSDDPETIRCDQCGGKTTAPPRADGGRLCPRCEITLKYFDRAPAAGVDQQWYLDAGYYRDPTH